MKGTLLKISKKKLKVVMIATLSLCFCILAGLCIYGMYNLKRLPQQTFFSEVNLSSKTYEEAKEVIASIEPMRLLESSTITFSYNEDSLQKTFKDFEAKYNIQEIHKEIENIIAKRSFLGVIKELFTKEKPRYNIDIRPTYSQEAINGFIEEVKLEYNKEPVNASMKKEGGEFHFTKDIEGIAINEKELEGIIRTSIESFKGTSSLSIEADLPHQVLTASITEESLQKSTHLIGKFTTYLTSDNNRNTNITIAASTVNGTILAPGETFSLNKALGPRTRSKGYLEAGAFMNGQLVKSIAGGICQVATTLYNTALLTNLEIAERKPHSLTVSYIPYSLDATISGDTLDIRFVNNQASPIYIESYVSGRSLVTSFYGEENTSPYSYKFSSKVISNNGTYIKTQSYKHTYMENELISTEVLNTDTYKLH